MSCYRRRFSRRPVTPALSSQTPLDVVSKRQGPPSTTLVVTRTQSVSTPDSSTPAVQTSKSQQRRDIFNGVVFILESINEVSDAFPPLKSAAAALLKVLNTQKDFTQNQNGWIEYGKEITSLLHMIEEHISLLPESSVPNQTTEFVKVLSDTLTEVTGLLERGFAQRAANVKADKDQLAEFQALVDREQQKLNTSLLLRLSSGSTISTSPELATPSISSYANIPPPPVHFYGRIDIIQGIIQAIKQKLHDRGAHLCLRGPGGIGKTAIAQFVYHHDDTQSSFGPRRYFIACDACNTLALLLTAIAAAIKADTSDGNVYDSVLAALKSSNDPLLLILDNAETFWISEEQQHVIHVLQHISTMSHITLIMTIRGVEKPYGVEWDHLEPVDVLTLEAARTTFLHIATDVKPSDSVDRLLRKVDCVPLAVTLLARLAQTETVEVLHDRLAEEKSSLMQVDFADHREQNIELSVKVSIDAAPMRRNPGALRFLSIISHFPSGASLKLLKKLRNIKGMARALHLLKQLSLAYIPSSSSDLITTWAPIRLYVSHHHPLSSMDKDGDQDIIRTWYLELAALGDCKIQDTQFKNALQALTPEKANMEYVIGSLLTCAAVTDAAVMAALHYSRFLQNTIPSSALLERIIARLPQDHRLYGSCLHSIGYIKYLQGQHSEADQRLTEALGLLRDDVSIAKCLHILGNVKQETANYVAADELLLRSKKLFQDNGLLSDAAHCQLLLGVNKYLQYRWEDAEVMLEEAKATFTSMNDEFGIACCLQSLGDYKRLRYEYGPAEKMLNDAKKKFEHFKSNSYIAQCLRSLGEIKYMVDQYPAAHATVEQAKSLFQQLGQIFGVAQCLQSLGNIQLMQAHYDTAEEFLSQSMTLFRKTGHLAGVAECTQTLGDIRYQQRQYLTAKELLEDARKRFEEMDDQNAAAKCWVSLGDVDRDMGKYADAEAKFEQAKNLFENLKNWLSVAQCLQSLGESKFKQGLYELAEDFYQQAMKQFSDLEEQRAVAQCLVFIADIQLSQQHESVAKNKLEKAMLIFKEIGDNLGIADCTFGLGKVHLASGDIPVARTLLLQAREDYGGLHLHDNVADCANMLSQLPDN
ncbi:TPR-like protein [Sistotremastrum niveocremeum HHB9708]|uniref:TPR-like protein n=1 Tax=Sistotremastrum niveocremeum HHB9708 TaxID=1314777 RepID=A0A164YP77_9AGAM|nr:TPR-like protein [Sistotremastrum niveocremeum HHB9708]